MEVLNFQIESLASTEPAVTQSAPDTTPEAIRSDELEEKNLNEVVLTDMVYFKRVVRRPPKIKIVPVPSSLVPSRQPSISVTADPHSDSFSSPGAADSVEIFKSFRVGMEDPCWKILPAALKKYNIFAPWHHYALYIVYGDRERCLGVHEKPLVLFKELDKEGKKPMFMLRKLHPSDIPVADPGQSRPPPAQPKDTYYQLESFRVAMEDPCSESRPAVPRKYTLTSPWRTYDLYIVSSDGERRCREKDWPLLTFNRLDWEGKKPRFELRRKNGSGHLESETIRIEKQNLFPGSVREKSPRLASEETEAITDSQVYLENGSRIWSCHRCWERKLDLFMEGCPTCFHSRCKRCFVKRKSSTSVRP